MSNNRNEDQKIWLQAKKEHEATGKILDALKEVSQNERRRILNYLWDRYVEHPEQVYEGSPENYLKP